MTWMNGTRRVAPIECKDIPQHSETPKWKLCMLAQAEDCAVPASGLQCICIRLQLSFRKVRCRRDLKLTCTLPNYLSTGKDSWPPDSRGCCFPRSICRRKRSHVPYWKWRDLREPTAVTAEWSLSSLCNLHAKVPTTFIRERGAKWWNFIWIKSSLSHLWLLIQAHQSVRKILVRCGLVNDVRYVSLRRVVNYVTLEQNSPILRTVPLTMPPVT